MKKYLLFLVTLPLFSSAGIINVKNFGARGDGKTDDTRAIQAAIEAAPYNRLNTIYFPKGLYVLKSYTITSNYLENYILKMHSNLSFKGDGNTSIIKLGDHLFDTDDKNATAQLFYGTTVFNIRFSNLMVDMNGANNLCPASRVKNQRAIFINHGNDVTIENVTIKNNAGLNMIMIAGKGSRVLVQNNTFLNGGHYVGVDQENKNQVDFSFIYFEWDSTRIVNNIIRQENIDIALNGITGSIEIHGSYCYAAGNKLTGCSPGIYVTSSWHDMKNTIVEKNEFIQCTKGVSFWLSHGMDSIKIIDNKIQLTPYRQWKGYTSNGIEVPNGNTYVYDTEHANGNYIKNLTISGNTITAPFTETMTDRTCGMMLHSLYSCNIENNIITGMNFGSILLFGSKWGSENVNIKNNQFINFTDNIDKASTVGYLVVFDSYTKNKNDGPGIKNIVFSNNDLKKADKNARLAVQNNKEKGRFTGAFIAVPEYMLKEVHFESNSFPDAAEQPVYQTLK